jgi:xanthine dehydrogenase accessory factor
LFDRAALASAIAAYGPVARVVVAEVKGSAPREVGAAMLLWAGGQEGTIGGGALEFKAAAAARDLLAAGEVLRTDSVPLGPNLGQCCGGAVQLLTEVFHEAPEDGLTFARPISTNAGPIPLAIIRAQAAARQGQKVQAGLHKSWFIEPFCAPKTPVWVWGAGHVGRAIVGVMAPLPDVEITWVDTDLTRYPDCIPNGVRALPAADITRAIALAPAGAHHVILTFSHALDLALCDGLLKHSFAACGVIGSATKWARFRARLAALGHAPADISRIMCPIGDPSLGKHPQAIAIGVAARMMAQMAAIPALQQEVRA